MSDPLCCRQAAGGVIIDILVQPRASRNELVGLQGEELKVRLTSPPVDGAANRLCTDFFARLLDVARGDVQLLAGEKSRHKRLLIRGAQLPQVQQALAPHLLPPS
ncbi:MAG: YggU family protein [Desulfuromonadales bacterium]|nr:YggU family protein [Desulfuromonadales bacterium]